MTAKSSDRPSLRHARRFALGEGLLAGNQLQHVVSIQHQGAAPERRLKEVVDMFAFAVFTYLDEQYRSLKQPQDAGGERRHLSPSGIIPGAG